MSEMLHYCFLCGEALQPVPLEGRLRLVCPACGWVHYPQLKVSAAALIEQEGKLLLVQRAYEPWKGQWYLPAGYVEVDEPPAQAADRETREETGLDVRANRLLDACYFDDDPRGNGVLMVYACQIVAGSPSIRPETTAYGFFGPHQLPQPITGAGHQQAVRDWLRAVGGGLVSG